MIKKKTFKFNFKKIKDNLKFIEKIYKIIGINLKLIGYMFGEAKYRRVDNITRYNCERALEFASSTKKEFKDLKKDLKKSFWLCQSVLILMPHATSFFKFINMSKKSRKMCLNKIL
ncbi:hypothetical protein TUBRATIS_15580 [Tubulinosema ratisbonensis]|uniref:Uncharacterized protein n=1 Tax=Tubulinosema ratisbonensis TaxID=291195 RepID=A0A437ALJ5_9MICR|nr:hypothetical protein TUBRATIS_15580 [Tubulinosema ratisbonensis]